MKRKIFLTLVLVTMFFIGSNNVDALSCKVGESGCTRSAIEKELNAEGKELACLYETTVSNDKYYNYIYYDRWETDSNNFQLLGNNAAFKNVYGGNSTLSIKSHNVVFNSSLETNACPKNSYIMRDNHSNDYICFDDEKSCLSYDSSVMNYETTTSKLVLDNINNIIFKGTDNYKDYINESDYCFYNLPLNNYDNSYIVYSLSKNGILYFQDNGNKKFTLGLNTSKKGNDFLNTSSIYSFVSSSHSSCPSEIYHYYHDAGSSGKYYLFRDEKSNEDGVELKSTFKLYTGYDNPDFNKDQEDIGCEIFSEELRNIINDIMSYIRIGVPLLLIVLIGLDFGKASFSGDEKAISKSKKNAITRIIIAVIIFFVPTILNLIFNIANDVWADAHYEICVIDEK